VPPRIERALRVLERVDEWPLGWRAAAERFGALAATVEREAATAQAIDGEAPSTEPAGLADLALVVDAESSTSLSLLAFRRPPRAAVLASVAARRGRRRARPAHALLAARGRAAALRAALRLARKRGRPSRPVLGARRGEDWSAGGGCTAAGEPRRGYWVRSRSREGREGVA
jgi:hypothetical protein